MDPDKKPGFRRMTKFQAGFFLFILIVMVLAFIADPPESIEFWPTLITFLAIIMLVGTASVSTFIGVDYLHHPATKHIIFLSFNALLYAEPLYQWYMGVSSPVTIQDVALTGISVVFYAYSVVKQFKRASI